jgi:hypothetical protein
MFQIRILERIRQERVAEETPKQRWPNEHIDTMRFSIVYIALRIAGPGFCAGKRE